MLKFAEKLAKDERGTAVTEFALWTTALFLVVMAGLDFGTYYMQRGQLNEAVSAAAVQTFEKRENVDFNGLQAYVRNLADDQTLTLSTSCNGVANACTNFGRTCSCLKSNGTYTAATCGSSCSGTQSTAGYYVNLKAEQEYKTAILPKSLMGGSHVRQSATLRLN